MSLSDILFSIGTHDFTIGHLIATAVYLVLSIILYRVLISRVLLSYFRQEKIITDDRRKIVTRVGSIFILLVLLGLVWLTQLNLEIFSNEQISFHVNTFIQALLILQVSRLADWLLTKFLIINYYRTRQTEIPSESVAKLKKEIGLRVSNVLQYAVYLLAIILILQSFDIDYTIFNYQDKGTIMDFKISNIFKALLILLLARLLSWIIVQLFLHQYYQRKNINIGSQYAVNQLLTYVLYVVAALMALETLGVKMTVIWGGAAALLVGVGLGLQQTFNDLISGIILLFERTVEVGDVIQVENMMGSIKKIGLRTSLVNTLDNVTVILPNSKLVSDNVINWSHEDLKARFFITVGVAYGSDTALVKKLLLEAASSQKHVLTFPNPLVRFSSFGDSSLDFELHFWTKRYLMIEDIKSDIRFEVDRLFREYKVTIPFPQRDIHLFNSPPKKD